MTVSVIPSAAGVNHASLGYLDAHLNGYITTGKLAGAFALVCRHRTVVHRSTHGLMDRERNKPMRPDTIVRIYSMSKPVTSVALMQLHERGLVQLDDPVDRYIPAWSDLRVYVSGQYPDFVTRPCDRPMTVRDLLSHQSGLTYGFGDGPVDAAYRRLGIGIRSEGCRDLAGLVGRLAEVPLLFSPGAAWNYSLSTDVVGYLVQEISGQRFDRYVQEQILDPLGMKDTGFWVRPEQLDRFAANYGPSPDGGPLRVVDDPQNSPYTREPTLFSGGGGMVGTGEDYLRFCQMLLNGGALDGERILGRKTIALMLVNHLTGGRTLDQAGFVRGARINAPGRGFGLGFSVMLNPAESQIAGTPGEGAWSGAASTAFWVDPAEDLAVVFITQFLPGPAAAGYNLTRELRAIVYGALD